MYKINFHRDYDQNQRRARRNATWRTGVAVVLAIELGLLGSLGISNLLIREQVSDLEASLPRLRAQVSSEDVDATEREVRVARELVRVRGRRMDWSPKLASITQHIDRSMRLSQLEARASAPRVSAELKLQGQAAQRSHTLETVTQFVDRLREDTLLSIDLPLVELGSVEGDRGGTFQVVATPGGGS